MIRIFGFDLEPIYKLTNSKAEIKESCCAAIIESRFYNISNKKFQTRLKGA